MRSYYIIIVVLGFLATLIAVPIVNAEVEISRTEPKRFVQGNYTKSSLPIIIYFDKNKMLPKDITGFNVNARVKVYARAEGNFEEVHSSAWTRGDLVVWIPTRLFVRKGFLEVKVSVDGQDSDIYYTPVVPPPSKLPVITNVSPDGFPGTDASESKSLYITGTSIDNYGFTGVLIDDKKAFIGNVVLDEKDGGAVIAMVPKEILGQSGLHNLQVTTRAGKSNIVKVWVGEKPTIFVSGFQFTKSETPTLSVESAKVKSSKKIEEITLPGISRSSVAISSEQKPITLKESMAPTFSGAITIEGEDLFLTAQITKGPKGPVLSVQPMDKFGPSWSKHSQLFWQATQERDKLKVIIDIPVAGKYRLSGYFTKAPDYGSFQVNHLVGTQMLRIGAFDGYNSAVVHSGTILGPVSLSAGNNTLLFEVRGKHARSSGYFVGIDKLEFTPLD